MMSVTNFDKLTTDEKQSFINKLKPHFYFYFVLIKESTMGFHIFFKDKSRCDDNDPKIQLLCGKSVKKVQQIKDLTAFYERELIFEEVTMCLECERLSVEYVSNVAQWSLMSKLTIVSHQKTE